MKKLGINTIWISPFYKTSQYHGYHIEDFYKVDPHFGSEHDIKELIKKAHDNNFKIIADFVPNHCSRKHLPGIQIELNRALYMNEKKLTPKQKDIKRLNLEMHDLIQELDDYIKENNSL